MKNIVIRSLLAGLVSALVACTIQTNNKSPGTEQAVGGSSPGQDGGQDGAVAAADSSAANPANPDGAPAPTDDAGPGEDSGNQDPDAGGVGPVPPAVSGDRRFAAAYLYLSGNPNRAVETRFLCEGGCNNINDIEIRSLCLSMAEGTNEACENIQNFNLRNFCRGECGLLSSDPALRNLCLAGGSCNGIDDLQMRSYCLGQCNNISQDLSLRSLCLGQCTLIN